MAAEAEKTNGDALPAKLVSPVSGKEVEVVKVRTHPQFAGKLVVQGAEDSFQWTYPMPSIEELQRLYSEDYNSMFGRDFTKGAPPFQQRRAAAQLAFVKEHAPAEALSKVKKIAEAGAGWGGLSLALKEALPSIEVPKCFELDGAAVTFMRDQGLDGMEGMLETSDLAKESLDMIVSSHVVEHLRDPRDTLTRWRDLLAPEGLLFTEIPLENPVPNWWGQDPEKPYWVGHLYFYSPGHFEAMLGSLGFDVLAATAHDHTVSPGFVMPGSAELYNVDAVDPALDAAVSTAKFPRVYRVLARKQQAA